jgi:hypothetical protein
MELTEIDTRIYEDERTGCWVYTGPLSDKGYARVSYEGKVWSLHRLSWTLLNGPIPKGLVIDHLCRNRACCNPAHLEPVTDLENIRRSPIHHGAKTHCAQGHPFSAENTGIAYHKGTRHRYCRTCQRACNSRCARVRRAARKAAAAQ